MNKNPLLFVSIAKIKIKCILFMVSPSLLVNAPLFAVNTQISIEEKPDETYAHTHFRK